MKTIRIPSQIRKVGFVCGLVLMTVAVPGWAATIVSNQGTSPGNAGTKVAASFTTTSSYTNVDISIGVYSYLGTSFTPFYNAYLTTKIGPGTTIADVVTNVSGQSISIPASGVVDLPLFSGLSLAPGTYFLTLEAYVNTADMLWVWIPPVDLTTVLAPGTTLANFRMSPESPASFFPATDFSGMSLQGNMWFSVTGDLAQGAAVPEPSTMVLCLSGLVVLVGARLRRRSL